MTVGNNIKRIRIEQNLTQKELAEKLGCAEITIRQYELDKRQPNIKQLQKLAVALNVPTEYLFDNIRIDICTESDLEKIDYLLSNGIKDIQSLLLDNGYSLIRQDNDHYIIQNLNSGIRGKKIQITSAEFQTFTKDIDFFIKYLTEKLFNNHDNYTEKN